MLSLLFTTALTLLSLLTLTTALPSPSPAADTKVHHSRSFRLKSRVLAPDSGSAAFDGLLLEPYHIYPAFNYATLEAKSKTNKGIVGYLNGTREELDESIGNLLFKGSDFPYGFIIDKVNSTYNPIEINAGPGTKGVFIDQGVIKYFNPQSGGFYACKTTLLYGPAIQAFYKPKTSTTPAGCYDVELVVKYV